MKHPIQMTIERQAQQGYQVKSSTRTKSSSPLSKPGTRLPDNYTIILGLPTNEIIRCPTARRKSKQKSRTQQVNSTLDSDNEEQVHLQKPEPEENLDTDTDTNEDTRTRTTNAYSGSTNTIGSIH
jgi:hypothetical protein